MELRDYSERKLADKIKVLEKEKQTYLDKDNLDKTFFVRCDGRSFKNFTRGFEKPFDGIFRETMERTMIDLCEEIQGSVLGFTQSDEITIMFKKNSEESDIYFSGKVEKIVSEVAAVATLRFNVNYMDVVNEYIKKDLEDAMNSFDNEDDVRTMVSNMVKEEYKIYTDKFLKATFDARVFEISKDEELEPIIWRMLDCYKNAIQMIARTSFSQKQLHKKSVSEMAEMLEEKGIKINSFDSRNLYGKVCVKEPRLLYEGTERECVRNKWIRKDALDEIFKQKKEAN